MSLTTKENQPRGQGPAQQENQALSGTGAYGRRVTGGGQERSTALRRTARRLRLSGWASQGRHT